MYVARGPGGFFAFIDLPIEDAMPELRRLSAERREKIALHRVEDLGGAKLAVAAPFWRGVNTADTKLPGDPKMVPKRASAANTDLALATSAWRRK